MGRSRSGNDGGLLPCEGNRLTNRDNLLAGNRSECHVKPLALLAILRVGTERNKELPRMIVWTEYMKYRAGLRGFDLSLVEKILRFSEERYYDTGTGRKVVVGRHGELLVMIPYEQTGDDIVPVTIHATTRQQINFRLKSGRFSND